MSSTSPTPESAPGPIGNHFDKYGSANAIERRMMAGFMASLDRLIDGPAPSTVLEVGVGEGEVLQRVQRRFPAATCLGIDLPDDSLPGEWSARGITAEFGDVTALRFDDRSFELVLAIEVLEHVPDVDAALREIARVCNGAVVLSVPFEPIWRIGNMVRGRYLRDLGNTPGHVNHWTRWSFTRVVQRHFVVERVLSPMPWTMLRAVPRR